MTRTRGSGPLAALIADDEALARRRIVELLENRDAVRIVGQTGSGTATLRAIRELRPDLLFLDVQMPGLNGFEVLARLRPEERPLVIFSTAYDEHAIHAFEVHAVDYLLKPFADERFDMAVRRAEQSLRSQQLERASATLIALLGAATAPGTVDPPPTADRPDLDRFAVRTGDRLTVLPANRVDWIEAAGDYAGLHVGAACHLIRTTMAALEARLDPARFLRIHRSIIVQLDRIRQIRSDSQTGYEAILEDGSRLRVSRRYRDALLQRLGLQP